MEAKASLASLTIDVRKKKETEFDVVELDSSSDEYTLSEKEGDVENSPRTDIREPGARRTNLRESGNRRTSRRRRSRSTDLRRRQSSPRRIRSDCWSTERGPLARRCQLFE